MGRKRFPEDHCQAEALKLLGDYVTLRVIDFLRARELRFTELQRSLGDVNSVTLSNRLKRLEGAGVIERKEATIDRQSVAYRLTGLGEGLLPVLREIQNFTKRNLMRGTSLGLSATKAVGQKLPRAKSFPNR
ncbi:MAG: helix-turn-helix domain-containing protein [Spirochaetia bacterium]|jgi:DNA-binding HxlR family transcriptional regulator